MDIPPLPVGPAFSAPTRVTDQQSADPTDVYQCVKTSAAFTHRPNRASNLTHTHNPASTVIPSCSRQPRSLRGAFCIHTLEWLWEPVTHEIWETAALYTIYRATGGREKECRDDMDCEAEMTSFIFYVDAVLCRMLVCWGLFLWRRSVKMFWPILKPSKLRCQLLGMQERAALWEMQERATLWGCWWKEARKKESKSAQSFKMMPVVQCLDEALTSEGQSSSFSQASWLT